MPTSGVIALTFFWSPLSLFVSTFKTSSTVHSRMRRTVIAAWWSIPLQRIVLAREQGMPVMEFIQSVESWSNFIIDVLGPRDFAIYVAAVAAGYKFSYNNLSDQY